MDVYGDERFEFDPFDLQQIPSRLIDEGIQQLQEAIVRFGHDFLILSGLGEC